MRKYFKRGLAFGMTVALTAGSLTEFSSVSSHAAENRQDLQIWFDEPVSKGPLPGSEGGFGTTMEDNRWQQLSLPIGNGSIGANVYGEIARDNIKKGKNIAEKYSKIFIN